MSSDNGIYIARFSDGYRVIHAQCIDNIFYFPEGSKERKEVIANFFGQEKPFSTEKEGWEKAKQLYKEEDYIEYGITYLGTLDDFEEEIKKEETEFFECDCHDRDHLMILRKSFSTFSHQGKEYSDIFISLEMVVTRGAWSTYNTGDIWIIRKLKKVWWRIKESLKVLFLGYYKIEDSWIPCRTDDEFFNLIGVRELERLGETMVRYSREAEKFYKSKMKDENK